MLTSAEPPGERPVLLTMRQDLVIRAQLWGKRRGWVLKDPAAARYFHLREEEYAVLRMLDGRTSLAQIARRFAEQFAPRRVSQTMLQHFLAGLHRDGLVVSDAAGQGAELLARRDRRRTAERRAAWLNVMAIRLRGIDPDPLLRWLYPRCRWLFSPLTVGASLLLMFTAAILMLSRWAEVSARLPELTTFFTAGNLLPLLVTLATIKILHELGHALTARHFGGEVRELGVMFLFFTPCLYVNVSDAWLLPDRWRRIAISAAGMYVELLLASLAALLWMSTEPGLVNRLALNVAVLTSVNTLLLNGNPLLRYDGYYILCDLVQTPNLAGRAFGALRAALAQWCLGMPSSLSNGVPARRGWLLLYAVLSLLYRVLMVSTLLLLTWQALEPYGLTPLAMVLSLMIAGQYAGLALAATVRLASHPARRRQINPRRSALTAVALGTLALLSIWMPVPWSVTAPVVLRPSGAKTVYVSVPGRVLDALPSGSKVQSGQTITQLENLAIAREVVQLRGRRQRQARQVANLESTRGNDPASEQQLATAREGLADLNEQLARREADQAELTLTAPQAGVILPVSTADREPARGMLPVGKLRLVGRDAGLYLPVGTPVCAVGDPHELEGVLTVAQADIDLLTVAASVRVRLAEFPGQTLRGEVIEIAASRQEIAPRESQGESGSAQPDALQTAVYQVRVKFSDLPPATRIGALGTAKIAVAGHSLAWWGARRWSELWK